VIASGSSGKVLLLVFLIAGVTLAGWLYLRTRSRGLTPGLTTATTSKISTTTRTTAIATPPIPTPGDPASTSTAPGATPAAEEAASDAAAASKQCSLVSRAEMENILGLKVVKVSTTEQTCSYFTDAVLSAEVETTWTGGKAAIAQVKGFNGEPGLFVPVPGIGDEAYLQAAGVLHVLKGDTYVVVNSREYPNGQEAENAIARKAMEKLP
jgi:hypothetical protein